MTWLAIIKAALVSLAKLPDFVREMVAKMGEVKDAIENNRIQEVRNAQRELQREVQGIKNDAERAAFVRRLSELERKL